MIGKIKRFIVRVVKKARKDKAFRIKLVLLSIIVLIVCGLVWVFWGSPLPSQLTANDYAVSTKIFDRKGKLIFEIFGNQRRTPVKLDELPKQVKDATLAIEDKDFYSHRGFSITGIARSLEKIIFERKLEGGSTITQQLVKNSLLTPERTVRRKLREFALSILVETIYSKDQILEMYLNQIPYGGTAYGIEAASETYFGKSAKELSLSEAAYLAGLPAAPSTYSPFGAHPELAKQRQELVLSQMVNTNFIKPQDADKAKSEQINLKRAEGIKAPHFALWIKEQLADKYGERVTEQGGLRVTTTLDLDLQEEAENIVATEVARLTKQKVGNGAAIVTRPQTGEILAMVGSKDYFAQDEDGKVNIIFASRQPGSSIKPLNYALAIRDKKITASTPLADVPTCFSVLGQASYCPVNYDGTFHGAPQARFALGNSFNIPAVRVLALNGIENFISFARTLGITTFTDPKNYGLSLTLGGGEVKPSDMAVAYGTFANSGVKEPLISILKVEDWKGQLLDEIDLNKYELSGEKVLEPDVAYIISHILLDNNARAGAFGTGSYLVVSGHPEVSVKTGTTNDRRDNWTIGYTKNIVVVTWVGNNDNTPMSGAVSGVSGASPIWNRIIKKALDRAEKGVYNEKDKGHGWQEQPNTVYGRNVCTDNGNLADSSESTPTPTCPSRFEYFLKDKLGASQEAGTKDLQIDKTTQILANPAPLEKGGTIPENIETQNHPYLIDPLGTLVCLNCPVPTWPVTVSYPLRQ